MTRTIALGWGRAPLTIEVPAASLVVSTPAPPPAKALPQLLRDALASPIQSAPLRERARGVPLAKVVVIGSDATRDEPRRAMLEALRQELVGPGADPIIAVANGTHRPCPDADLDLPPWANRVVQHDGWNEAAFVDVGRTARGT